MRHIVDRFVQEIRIALRALRRTPTFTVTVVLILGLAIGMTAGMATVYDAVLLKKLPVADENHVVVMWPYRGEGVEASPAWIRLEPLLGDFKTVRDVAGVAHWGVGMAPLTDGDRSVEMNLTPVTGNFFEVLGARPAAGRLMRPEDGVPGAPPVIVLSYRAWRERFAGDTSVVGRKLVDGYGPTIFTVIGVAPAGLDYPVGVECWIPEPSRRAAMNVVARLAPGSSIAAAKSEFRAIVDRLGPRFPYDGVSAATLPDIVVGNVRPALVVLTSAVGLLLLIACVNVGNLLLLRGAARSRELSIRRALGASCS